MKSFVLLTSDHRRHLWLASRLAAAGELLGVVCEAKPASSQAAAFRDDEDVEQYFAARDEAEERWFGSAAGFDSLGAPILGTTWGQANSAEAFRFVASIAPDLVILFGSSIIREPLLAEYDGRIINMHLGLSPYYRGSATNFWPLVDGLPECVGVTIHHATLKVDGGDILGQARPAAAAEDSSHDLGCKSIMAGVPVLESLLRPGVALPEGFIQQTGGRLCRRADFMPDALRVMQRNFAEGMMRAYLADKDRRDSAYPILASTTPP